MRHFYRLLVNTLIANITTSFLWFALTFWVYLETQNVMATAILGGSYMLMMAVTGIFFGTLVDRHHKKRVMEVASAITAATYLAGGIIFVLVDHEKLLTIGGPWFWLFTTIILIGCIVENIRNIALSTCVTIMVPKDRRAGANGMVGMVQGLAFMLTSIFSGLAIGYLGMGWTLAIAITLIFVALIDLFFVTIDEKKIAHDPNLQKLVDIRGAWQAIRAIPGLFSLILFATFNNLIGGVFMALLDPYGLSLTNVQTWGFVYALSSIGFIIGGGLVAKLGLGRRPLKILLVGNIIMAMVGMIMGIRESLWLLAGSMLTYMSIVPIIEAAEQTTLQAIVPVQKQGRVFGFGQSVEAAASPITAYLIGPLAQLWLIPYMNSPAGQQSWGWLLGSGHARGMALAFVAASLLMLVLAVGARFSPAYRLLSDRYTSETTKVDA
jgi:DHA3 family multidrug efflux protein-like MFS transporter